MTETTKKPRRKVFRTLLVTAVVMALAVAVAMGANAATNGELYRVTFGKWLGTVTLDDGTVADVYQGKVNGEDDMTITVVEGDHLDPQDGDSHDSAESDEKIVTEQEFTVETDGNNIVVYDSDGNVVSNPQE